MPHRLAAALALLVAACIPTEPIRRPAPHMPVEQGRSGEAITIDSVTGVILARTWRPTGASRAVALLIPAHGEASAAVGPLAERLAAAGATVLAPERHGTYQQPLSWSDERWRTARLALWLRRKAPDAPLFLVGRGDGGTLALDFALADTGAVAGVTVREPVLTARSWLPQLALWSLAPESLMPTPLHRVERLWDGTPAIDEPLLIVPAAGGDADAVARDFAARTSSADRTVDADADLAGWIETRLSGTATPAVSPPAPLPAPGLAFAATFAFAGERREDGELADSGVFHVRLAHGRLGWAGALGLRSTSDGHELAVMPLGVGLRVGNAGQLALVGGLGLGGELTGIVPVEASGDMPLGRHLRGLASATVTWDLDDHRPHDLAASIDDVQLRLGLRVLRDGRYWRRVVAGTGAYLAATYRRRGDEDIAGFELGYHLWGSR
jgi:alpha-beta hydrolase superfamily lysophospholipase